MEPIRFDGASVDRSVLRRLRRLDKNLRVTFAPVALDTFTGRPILMSGRLDPMTGVILRGPVSDPGFYLWRKDRFSSHHFFVQSYPAGPAGGFGHLEVLKLEMDLARHHSPDALWRIVENSYKTKHARAEAAHKQLMLDKALDNKKLIWDTAVEGKPLHREAKAFSYRGQAKRTSSGEGGLVIPRSDRDLGLS
jgi:hypothetical protein